MSPERLQMSSLPTTTLRAVENVVNQLRNDMRTVAESRCRIHGCDGGTTANSASTLLPCIGIEIVAMRSRAPGESRDGAIRRAYQELAHASGYQAYRTIGFPLHKALRNGLAHAFWPNEIPSLNGPNVFITPNFWLDAETQRSVCIDEIGPPLQSRHLVNARIGDDIQLSISALHWVRDVDSYLDQFCRRLANDSALQSLVEANDQQLMREAAQGLSDQLTDGDRMAIGI